LLLLLERRLCDLQLRRRKGIASLSPHGWLPNSKSNPTMTRRNRPLLLRLEALTVPQVAP